MAGLKGIREYNRIRKYLEKIYLYGFFSRNDFAEAGVGSVKDYDYGVGLIHSVFPETEEAALWQDNKKYLRFQRRYADNGTSDLANSYMLYPLNEEEDLPALLWLLSFMGEKGTTPDRLNRLLELHCEREEPLSYGTVRRWAKDLAEHGYIIEDETGFRAGEAPFSGLSLRELEQLYHYVLFAAGTGYPRVPGSFLLRTLERERLARGVSEEPAPFLFRHNKSRGIFDEDAACAVAEAIREKREVELSLDSGKLRLLPVRVRVDTRMGRWYLLGLADTPIILRLSAIRGVKPLAGPVDSARWEAAEKQVREAFSHVGVSGDIRGESPVLVEAELRFGNNVGRREQFARELRLGKIVREGDRELYRAEVMDPGELVPLLRSYSPWLTVLPGPHGLDKRLRESLLTMRKQLTGDDGNGTAE